MNDRLTYQSKEVLSLLFAGLEISFYLVLIVSYKLQ